MFSLEATKAAFRLYLRSTGLTAIPQINTRTKVFVDLLKAEQGRRLARKGTNDPQKDPSCNSVHSK